MFINTPKLAASRHRMPATRAAVIEPPSFPMIATKMINAQQNHIADPLTRLMVVRSPVKAKKMGSNRITATDSSLLVR
jgi:hypothetical protein